MPQTQSFRDSVNLILQVHRLMGLGEGDSLEANQLRAKSEKPWYEMTDDEQELAEGLSEDLYSIGKSWDLADDSGDDFTLLFREAQKSGDWLSFLSRLRNQQREFSPHQLAFIRGLAWLNLKEPLVALEFFSEAVRLLPNETQYLRCLLCTLNYEGLWNQSLVERVVHQSSDALSLLHAAGMLFNESANAQPPESTKLLESAYQVAQRAVQLAENSFSDDLLVRELARTHVWLALYHEGLGERAPADDELEKARKLGYNEDEIAYVESLFKKNRHVGSWGLLAQSYSEHQHSDRLPMVGLMLN